MEYILFIVGALLGVALGMIFFQIQRRSLLKSEEIRVRELEYQIDLAQQANESQRSEFLSRERLLETQVEAAVQRTEIQKSEFESRERLFDTQIQVANRRVEELQRELQGERDRLKDQKEEFTKMQNSARIEFEKVATDILERKTKSFMEVNEQSVSGLLKPLGNTITEFKERIEQTFTEQTKQRTSLEAQVRELVETTAKVGAEANNLASALKGDNKKMGNWGEMILESILENSGLVRDREYEVQATLQGEDGKVLRPDVIVRLPEGRAIIIDSKVSLVAYDKYSNSSNDTEVKVALTEHIRSIRTHVASLASKRYDNLEASLDFTMMFIPIEPAYLLAIKEDEELWSYAYNNRVLLISPTNLIACLKLISDLWKREMQSKNAMDIVKRAELMYEKFVGFVDNMETLGNNIAKTQSTYNSALSQLSTGRGNLINQADKMRQLGLKSSKRISDTLIEGAQDDAEQLQ